jgi:predicted double-glycine peptidase
VWGAIGLTGASLFAQIGIGELGLRADRPLRSMKDLRDQAVVKQRFDFSCGAAALATLIRYGFGQDVSEAQILVGLFDLPTDAEKAARKRTGFSLLDLQRVAQARGYNAEGFRLERAQLSMLAGPALVFIEPRGYKHFAVIRGVRGDRVYLADPSRGNIRMPMYAFLDSWLQDDGKGIVFVVEPKTGLPDRPMALSLSGPAGQRERLRPEVISAREMLAIGNALMPGARP